MSGTEDWRDDPVAQRCGWQPARDGGFSFRVQQLVHRGPNEIAFEPTAGKKAFDALFGFAGAGILLYGLAGLAPPGERLETFLVGAVFLGAGLYLRWWTRPVVIDRIKGTVTRGNRPLKAHNRYSGRGITGRLRNAHALQIVEEHVQGNKQSFMSYELNLVFGDGRRLNLTDHGDLDATRRDARELGRILDLPVWER